MSHCRELTLRAANADDADAIAETYIVSIREAYAGLLPDALLARQSAPDIAAMWQAKLSDGESESRVTVALEEGTLLGFIEVGQAGREEGLGEVRLLFVHPRAWGAGIARTLLAEGLDQLSRRKYREAVLWVYRDNESARRLYERSCWTFSGDERLDPALAENGIEVWERKYRIEVGPPRVPSSPMPGGSY